MIAIIALSESLVFAGLGALHFYWAAGGRRGSSAAVPEIEGRPTFAPRPAATAMIGVLLLCAAGLVFSTSRLWMLHPGLRGTARVLTAVLAAVFILRAIGDRKYVGFFKRVKGTRFARFDTRIYAPLCLLLGAGAVAIAAS
jgi:hypothetical protein